MIAHVLPQCGNEYGTKGCFLGPEPDPGPFLQADGSQEHIQNTVFRVVDLKPELSDNDCRDQYRHKVYGKEDTLAFHFFAQSQGQKERQRQLQEHRQKRQQQRVAQCFHEADVDTGKDFLIIGKTYEGLICAHTVPFEQAVVERSSDRRDQYPAEQEQRRQEKNQNMQFITVHSIHDRRSPFCKGRRHR